MPHVQGVLPETFVEGFHDPEVVKRMPYAKFGRSGRLISKLSLGASSFGNVYGTVSNESDCHAVLLHAIKSGVNLIDTAPWYGHGVSEEVLGRGLKGVPRKAYYLSTKVGRYFPGALERFDFSYERTLASVEESLARLQLDYIDVVQVHDPEFAPTPDVVLKETLPALQRLKEQGKIRHIGITGYPLSILNTLAERCPAGIEIESALSYSRYNLHDDSLVSSGCLARLTGMGIGVINGSPYSMGLLIQRGPPVWHPAKKELKERCAAASKRAAELGFDIAHLAMTFCYDATEVATTMTSSTSITRLQGDLDMATGAHDVGEAGRAAIRALREEFFSGPGYSDNLAHWEGEEVAAYWVKVGRTLMSGWYTQRALEAGREAPDGAAAAAGPRTITEAHAVRAPALYKAAAASGAQS